MKDGYVLVVVGLFILLAVVTDWESFMNDLKAKFFVSKLGRKGARIFYGVFGMVFVLLGMKVILTGQFW